MRPWLLAPIAAAVVCCGDPRPGDLGDVVLPGDDFVVTGHVRVRPGTYVVRDADGDGVIHVRGTGALLDLTGVDLVGGSGRSGIGVSVEGAAEARVVGGTLHGFATAVRVTASPGAVVRDVTAVDAGSGLVAESSDGLQVYDCAFGGSEGHGIALRATSRAVVCRNALDGSGSGSRRAGVAVEGGGGNVIALNSATGCGVGIALAGAPAAGGPADAGAHVVWRNDVSGADAAGIVVEGRTGDVVQENRITSRDGVAGVRLVDVSGTQVRQNVVDGGSHGVELAGGSDVGIDRNAFSRCGTAVLVRRGAARDGAAPQNRVGPYNTFEACDADVRIDDVPRTRVVANVFRGPRPLVELTGDAAATRILGNRCDAAPVRILAHHTGASLYAEPEGTFAVPRVEGDGPLRVDLSHPAAHAPEASLELPPPFDPATLPGVRAPVRVPEAR